MKCQPLVSESKTHIIIFTFLVIISVHDLLVITSINVLLVITSINVLLIITSINVLLVIIASCTFVGFVPTTSLMNGLQEIMC